MLVEIHSYTLSIGIGAGFYFKSNNTLVLRVFHSLRLDSNDPVIVKNIRVIAKRTIMFTNRNAIEIVFVGFTSQWVSNDSS